MYCRVHDSQQSRDDDATTPTSEVLKMRYYVRQEALLRKQQEEIESLRLENESLQRKLDEWKRRFFKFANWSCRAGAFIKHNPEAAQWFEEE